MYPDELVVFVEGKWYIPFEAAVRVNVVLAFFFVLLSLVGCLEAEPALSGVLRALVIVEGDDFWGGERIQRLIGGSGGRYALIGGMSSSNKGGVWAWAMIGGGGEDEAHRGRQGGVSGGECCGN